MNEKDREQTVCCHDDSKTESGIYTAIDILRMTCCTVKHLSVFLISATITPTKRKTNFNSDFSFSELTLGSFVPKQIMATDSLQIGNAAQLFLFASRIAAR